MNDEEVISVLMGLGKREYVGLGRLKPNSGSVEIRLLLHDLGFALLDEEGMRRFHRLHAEARKRLSKVVIAKDTKRAELAKEELADAIKKVKGRMVISPGDQRNVTAKGTSLHWKCPKCGEKQEADLSKTEDDLKFIKVDGKYPNIRRRRRTSLQPIILPSGKKIFGESGAMKISSSSMDGRRGIGIVSMPPSQNKAAVIRLAKGDIINFGFDCSKCRFRNRIIEIGVKAR